jgi:alpha-L-rhamnosidase
MAMGRGRWTGLVAAAMTVVVAAGLSAPPVGAESAPGWPARPNWAADVPAPRSDDVRPVAVVSTSGSVSGASALVSGHGQTTFTDRLGGPTASAIIDYGEDVGGIPFFDVQAVSGTPTLTAAYSEGRQYLGPQGDQAPSASPAGDDSRADTLIAAYPGLLTTGLIQGGERYERIALTTPGRLTLSSAGIEFSPVRATADDYRGWFDSSSTQLNRIWFDGAYTTQLNEIRPNSVPPAWQIVNGALRTVGGSAQLLAGSSDWTNYSMSFQTRVVSKSTGWMVRAESASSGYLLVLGADSDPERGSTLSVVVLGQDLFANVLTVRLPGLDAARWQSIRTTVDGSMVTTSINHRLVASVDTSSVKPGVPIYRQGGVGIFPVASTAMFRRLDVRQGTTTLFANALDESSALARFSGPDVSTPDPLATVVDGAKRDRVVWSGDLGTEAPTIFDSTDDPAFIKGSLQLLASYQQANGAAGTNVNPTAPLGTFPQSTPAYSASYSTDVVNDIATYYLYTKDLAFVRAQWPMITRELAYDRSLVDNRGLLVTNNQNGQDWDYYDGEKIGEVTAFNDIYYEALVNAATMADALGQSAEAAFYQLAGTQVRGAINQYLFNPSLGVYGMSNLEPDVVAQDANALAVQFGIPPATEGLAILQRMERLLPATPNGPEAFTANSSYRTQISPFITNDEVAAMFDTGQTDGAIDLIEQLWGHMDAPGPDDSRADWELVAADGAPGFGANTSLAHGWASGATAQLSNQVLGVGPTGAGFTQWSIDPHPGTLTWAEGEVPTPVGAISVDWAQDVRTGGFTLEARSPSGTTGTISVPVPSRGGMVIVRRLHTNLPAKTIRVPAGRDLATVPALGGVSYEFVVSPS